MKRHNRNTKRHFHKNNHFTRKMKYNRTQEKKTDCLYKPVALSSFEKEYEKELKEKGVQTKDIENELVKMFNTPFSPETIKPQDDYYSYINYSWLEEKSKELEKEKKYYVQVDSFRVTQEKVYYELMEIVKNFIKNNNSPFGKAVKKVYHSLLNLDEGCAKRYASNKTQLIDTAIKKNDFYGLLALFNGNELISWGSPINWTVMTDEKHPNLYRSNISSPQLTIYDYEIYIDNNTDDQDTKNYKHLFKRKYLNYIDEMFDAVLGKGHGLKSTDVLECEYDMLTAMGCSKVKNDNLDGYNILTGEKALSEYGFDWTQFTKKLGYTNVPETFICNSTNYLKCIMETLIVGDNWKSDKWRTYYLYIVYRQVIRFHKSWKKIYFDFHGKFVLGQPVQWPDEIYPVFGLSLAFNTFLTNQYIKNNYNQHKIDYVKNMAEDLLTVYKRIIKRNTWLSPKTKQYALKKLEHIKLLVGQPESLREDPILDYSETDAYNNMKLISSWRIKKYIELDGKISNIDIPVIDWESFKLVGKQSYIVNAFYTPTENSIYIPLAYLQKPFIDMDERGIEYNLAHIGYTIAHEMSHSLDDMGSKYDHTGKLFNWWTKEDRRKFDAKVNDVVKQYEKFAGYDGIKMDATLSTGENLADISGLAICEEYLRDFQDKNNDAVSIKYLSFRAFFVYIAIQARQKIFDEAVKAQLKTNPHPMDKYRTNCPLSRLKLFRSIYNIKPGDKMYWKSMDTIW
jgi:putative endopeptidase